MECLAENAGSKHRHLLELTPCDLRAVEQVGVVRANMAAYLCCTPGSPASSDKV